MKDLLQDQKLQQTHLCKFKYEDQVWFSYKTNLQNFHQVVLFFYNNELNHL